MGVDASKVGVGLAAVAAGLTAGTFGPPLIHGNDQAINVIVTVFSILAGFLIAIIAIVGDPSLMPPGSWRLAELQRPAINARLLRHKWLFLLYLGTLGLLFASIVGSPAYPRAVLWLERCYLAIAAAAFLLSLRLPGALMRMQQERIDAVIERRRAGAGLGERPADAGSPPL